ncbi:MAG TPA: T9SS type A sorting domain-containing protein [Patescibacteria group bacterium]|nr:T9SS type A sorting domain-containing protein [Patescibacteria group bacterium]
MHKIHLILLGCVAGGVSLQAQVLQSDVKPAAGDEFKNDKVQVSWTLGEMLTETLGSSATTHLSQGFHQPILKITSVEQVDEYQAAFSVYPNPTADFVTVSLKMEHRQSLAVELSDMRGMSMHKGSLSGEAYRIDMTGVPNGTYILRIINDAGTAVSIFKIEKLK